MSVLLAVGASFLAAAIAFVLLYAAHYIISVRKVNPIAECEDGIKREAALEERGGVRAGSGERALHA